MVVLTGQRKKNSEENVDTAFGSKTCSIIKAGGGGDREQYKARLPSI